jgi:uncharacterized SAM-binding protein YcdF (DUF218 family)
MQIFRTLSCIAFIVLVWMGSIVWFAYRIDSYELAPDVRADGIIVLTGGGGRIDHGLELLADGRGEALFITGVGKNVPLSQLLEKAPEAVRMALGIASLGRVTLGHEASNTIGNVDESSKWLRERGYASILLVTADYHMPRALTEFEAQIKDVRFIPAPVRTRDHSDLSWISDAGDRNIILSEFHKLVAAKLRHMLIAAEQK